jgi:hypothetical protein
MTDNLQRLIALAKADGGKFFVIDEQGVPQLVIMGIVEYEQVLIKKAQGSGTPIKAVKTESQPVNPESNEKAISPKQNFNDDLRSEVIDSTFDFEDGVVQPIVDGSMEEI